MLLLGWGLISAVGFVLVVIAKSGFASFAGVQMILWPLMISVPLLLSLIARSVGWQPDRLWPEQEHASIKDRIDELLASLGGRPSGAVDPKVLRGLHYARDFPKMLGWIKNSMGLGLRVGLRITEGTKEGAPMWIELPKPLPPIGSQAFKGTRVVVNAAKEVIGQRSFEWIVAGFAHELSHVVLTSLDHPLQDDEKAVDLTAMILGYDLFMVGARESRIEVSRRRRTERVEWLGYLTIAERDFARSYLRKIRRETEAGSTISAFCKWIFPAIHTAIKE